ncbi:MULTISPECIES: rRNA maturation RNase YbeY [Lachnospiraceae]|jgi:probable rRNA maturation factor|uniref:Endoribonuclease YbeY n=1 Tax=Faecalicatena acetigenes TaxID=2981790 RepID=A0ABT2T911_9FIRM|nr:MULTISPECIES: rRNA maturation RNase YbeY [Lachnospiraceae]MCU6746720.1 rRNA maturation RNase YbeY [Faecalicatena acetigenes]RGT74546.1 rRNA maturation RNase YbeY [Ruminococcus sp. AF18-22]SCH37864.1 Probable rRNA maturation factor [uncultured Clostridium sp.]
MSLYLEEEGEIILPVDTEEIARCVVCAVLEDVNCPYEAEVNLLLTTDEEIRNLNHDFRQIDKPTDVLSFPMLEFSCPGDFSDISEEQPELFDPDSGELILGDIVISKEKVLLQAEAYGHSIKREYAFLIAHSMLHLCGYDHIEEEDRFVMEHKQHEIMDKIAILR